MPYETEFAKALQRTHSWGLHQPPVPASPQRYLSPDSLAKVASCIQSTLGHLTADRVAAQCFAISGCLREALEDTLGAPLTYTLGYVNLGKRLAFHTPVDDLKQMLDAGRPFSSAFNLHAWLTLPSHEVIDATLATTYGLANDMPQLIGGTAFIHPDDMVGGQSYHPQLLGEDYLRRIGVMMEFKGMLLA